MKPLSGFAPGPGWEPENQASSDLAAAQHAAVDVQQRVAREDDQRRSERQEHAEGHVRLGIDPLGGDEPDADDRAQQEG